MTIYIVDIEAVDTRYTKQWKDHLPLQLQRATNQNVKVVSGGPIRRREQSCADECSTAEASNNICVVIVTIANESGRTRCFVEREQSLSGDKVANTILVKAHATIVVDFTKRANLCGVASGGVDRPQNFAICREI